MSNDDLRSKIDEAKKLLPFPLLLARLGLGEHAKKSARCPFHRPDDRPSFSMFEKEAGWFWKCFAGCGEGDEIEFLAKLRGCPRKEAIAEFLSIASVNGSKPPANKPTPANSAEAATTDEQVSQAKAVTGEVASRPLGELLDAVESVLRRYVVFPLREQATASALWVAHTWVIEAFDFTPYVHVFSAEKRSGKSRLLDVLELLVKTPWRDGGLTEAVLFRRIKRDLPTLLADEIDTVFHTQKNDGMENIRRMFNLGFTRGYKVSRCVGQNTNFEIEEFDPFCAKALCGIGRCLPDTVSDRSLPIELVRKSREEKAARFRKRDALDETADVKRELEAWAQQPGVVNALRAARPQIPGELQDRAEEICEPLLAIADMAGGEWQKKARAAVVRLCVQDEDASIGVKLLADIKVIFDSTGADKLTTIDILNALVAIEDDRPWATWWLDDLKHDKPQKPATRLAKMLKPYGSKERPIKAHTIRVRDATAKGYEIGDFKQAFERYLPAPEKPSQPSQRNIQGENCDGLAACDGFGHKSRNTNRPRENANCDGVTAVTASREGEEKEPEQELLEAEGADPACSWLVYPFNCPEWIAHNPNDSKRAPQGFPSNPKCEACSESSLAEHEWHWWFNVQTHAVHCQDCRETNWWVDGYEIDERGMPSCWDSSHTREERIAERTHHQLQKAARYRANAWGLGYHAAWKGLLAGETEETRRLVEIAEQFRVCRRAARRRECGRHEGMTPGEFLAQATSIFNATPSADTTETP